MSMQKLNLMPIIRLSYMVMLLSLPLAASAVDNPLLKGYCGPPPPNSWFEFSSSTMSDVKAQFISALTQRAFADYPAAVEAWFAGNGGATRQGSGCQIQLHASGPIPTTYCPDIGRCYVKLDGDTWSTCGSKESAHAINTFVIARGGCLIGYATDPEQYTIALQGLGVTLMPGQTLSTAYAKVTKSDGSAKSGAYVDLILTVEPENGEPIRAEHVGSISPNGGATGDDGRLNFVFTAPTAGGTHTVSAFCTASGCRNYAEGKIKVPGCPVEDVPNVEDIPPNGPDVLPLTLELERTKGTTLALLPAAQAGANCIQGKYPGAHISSGTRTIAYQQHFIDIWNKMIELNKSVNKNNPACKPLRDKIIAEKGCDSNEGCKKCPSGGHCLKHKPAVDSNHPKGNAFDVSESTIDGLLGTLRPNPPPNPPLTAAQQEQADIELITNWLATPPPCNLEWGGSFRDRVHFQTP